MVDRYTKTVLTVIASAMLYLCVVMTPLPAASAQTTQRPGEFTGPTQVVIVGTRLPNGETIPVSIERPVTVRAAEPLRVTGSVTTERSSNVADRVIVVGWEEGAVRDKAAVMRAITAGSPGVPVVVQQKPVVVQQK